MEKKTPIPEDMIDCLHTYFDSKEFLDDLNALFEEVQQAEYSKNPDRAKLHAESNQPQYALDSVIQFFRNAIEDTDECKDIISKIGDDQIKNSVETELAEVRKANNIDKTGNEMNKKEIVEIFKKMIMKEFKSINKEYFPEKVLVNDEAASKSSGPAPARNEDEKSKIMEEEKVITRMEDDKEPPKEESKPQEEAPKEEAKPQEEPPKEEAKPQEEPPKEEAKPQEESPKEEAKPQEEPPKEEAKPQEEPIKEEAKPPEEPPKEEAKPQEEPPKEEEKSQEELPKEEAKSQEEPPKEESKPQEEPPKEEVKPQEEPPKEEAKPQEEPLKEEAKPQEEKKVEEATTGIICINSLVEPPKKEENAEPA